MRFRSHLLILFIAIAGSITSIVNAADFECIRSISRIEVKDGKLYTTDSLFYQVNNHRGERFTDFSINYSKICKASRISAWIEDALGNRIRELKSSEFKDSNDLTYTAFYQDDRVKNFQVKHNKYPYRACYTVTYTEPQYQCITFWMPFKNTEYSTREAKLFVTLPKDYAVNTFAENVSEVRSDTLIDKIVKVFLVKGDPALSKITENVLFDLDKPRVVVVSLNFKLGVNGSLESWNTFGDWVATLNKGMTAIPVSEEQKVSMLVDGLTDTTQIVKTLYQYMQDYTRYINVSIGIGGWKTYPASYVSQNKYGDCKALTNFMKALLEVKGIKSYFVLVNAGQKTEEFITDLPCSQFNHILLAVPIGKDTVWLENTDKFKPFGYIGTFTQNRKALWVDGVKSHLVSMPILKKEDVLCFRRMNVSFDQKGNAALFAHFSYKGNYYESLKGFTNYIPEKDRGQNIHEYIPFSGYELKDWKIVEASRDSSTIGFQMNLTFRGLSRMIENEFYIKTFSIPEGFDFPTPAKMPITLGWPVCNVDSTIYAIPSGYKLKSLPEPICFSSESGKYVSRFFVTENKIGVYKKLEINSGKYSPDEYETLFAFLKKVKEASQSNLIILTRTQ